MGVILFLLQEGNMFSILEAKTGCMLGNLTFVLRFPTNTFYTSVNPLKQVINLVNCAIISKPHERREENRHLV